jgi:hypothetical protein
MGEVNGTGRLAWARPRWELVLLALVAVVGLSPVYSTNAQDVSRLCLTRALVQGRLTVSPCVGGVIDRASYRGRTYSDKAPGLSLLAVPAVEAVHLPTAEQWTFAGYLPLWAVRVLTSGVAFVLLALLVGRVSEGLVAGAGGFALVTFALGTLLAPLAATSFDHVVAAAFVFGAFVLSWQRRALLAGLAVGAGVAVEYQVAAALAVVGVYLALQGLRPLAEYVVGALPPLLLLGVYDWAAFGSPLHVSYRYVANGYAADQAGGFFGISLPRAHSLYEVFLADRGLLIVSPVLVVAAAGLLRLSRRYPAEAAVCAAIGFFFLFLNSGYFLPYGGASPGPRFVVPGLPFLALGIASALSRWRRLTIVLGAASVIATTTVTLTWALNDSSLLYPGTVWTQIARVPIQRGNAYLVSQLANNILVWATLNRLYSAAVVCACAATAVVVATYIVTKSRNGRG